MRTSSVDSSRTSTTCGSFLDITCSAIDSTSAALLTLYGIEVTTICRLPRGSVSTLYSPRSRTAPCPLSYRALELGPAVQDLAAGREVGSLDVLQQRFGVGVAGSSIIATRAVDDLAEVVRRDVRRHADGDAGRAVHQQLRHRGRQHDRLLARRIVGASEGHRLALEVFEQRLRDAGQPHLGVAHGRRAVAVERAEVALAVDQRVAKREGLRHAHHRLVGGGIAVRVILAEHFADHGRRFARLRARREAEVLGHGVENPPLHRLQSVAHVRQRPRGDDRQSVVEIALFGGSLEIGERLGHRVWRLQRTERLFPYAVFC